MAHETRQEYGIEIVHSFFPSHCKENFFLAYPITYCIDYLRARPLFPQEEARPPHAEIGTPHGDSQYSKQWGKPLTNSIETNGH